MNEPLDILVFSPHPDDAELGCAGSLILAGEAGLRVGIVDVSEGEFSSRGSTAQRKAETRRATEVLGLSDRLSLGLKDTEIGTDPAHRAVFIKAIRDTRPRIVLAPYWEDRHPDHAATGRLAREAFFFAGVSRLGSGVSHRPERLFHYMIHHPFLPSFVVEVSPVWERKKSAMMAFESQFQWNGDGPQTALSQPEFMRFTEARAVWFGAMIGAAYGEPFLSFGPVPLSGLPVTGGMEAHRQESPPYGMFL